jgi:DNA-binding response OmpR family regulator
VYACDEALVVGAIEVHIGKLRDKLGDDPARPWYIEAARGVGYKLLGTRRAE